MYKPGTQLIINKLWAAAAAHKLGFEIESHCKYFHKNEEDAERKWIIGFSYGWPHDQDKWRIIVTKSGPNATERFLPQRNDLIETVNDTHFIVTELLPDDPTWVGNKNQSGIQNPFIECRSIIERDDTPFPQFSEVIEP